MRIERAPRADRLPARFWSKVARGGEDECWLWRGSRNPSGHGQFGVGKKVVLAHRVAYLLERGEVPDGMVVSHSCREVACVNPRHLTVTSQSEMMRRRNPMKRHPKAEPPPRAPTKRLSEEQVREIRALCRGGGRQADLARRFGVSESTISRLVRGETWRRVPIEGEMPRPRLTPDAVREVRRRHGEGEDARELAREFGIHYSTVRRIVTGKMWRGT